MLHPHHINISQKNFQKHFQKQILRRYSISLANTNTIVYYMCVQFDILFYAQYQWNWLSVVSFCILSTLLDDTL